MFLAVQTQWGYAGDPPAHTQLKYGSVREVMDMRGVPQERRSELLSRLQVIEAEALKVLGRRRVAELAKARRQAARNAANSPRPAVRR